MLKVKECFYLSISSIICCILQYHILAGTHKIGRENCPYVLIVSLISFLIVNYIYKKFNDKVVGVIVLMIMFFTPFITYTLIEWFYFPASLFNTISSSAILYLFSVTFLSGGWIFTIALILNSNYRGKLANPSSYRH